jgi:uncharacterized protein YlzI (FlbEa/FlbD family)
MTTISLKSTTPDIFIPLLNNALEREKRIIRNSIEKVQKRIDTMARDLSVDPEELLSGQSPHSEADDMELIELEGELEILHHLKDELRELESFELCA